MPDKNSKKSGNGAKNKKDNKGAESDDGSARIDSLLDAGSGTTVN